MNERDSQTDPYPLTEATTKITLEGLPGSGSSTTRIDAKVQVKPINGGAAVRELNVAVMPLITVNLGISRVEDRVDLVIPLPATPKSKLDSALPDNVTLKKALNGIFKQCGVRFTVNGHSNDYVGNNAIHFDLDTPPNGILDNASLTDNEYKFFQNNSLLNPGALNLIILHDVKPIKSGGLERNAVGFCNMSPNGVIVGKQVFAFSRYWETHNDYPLYQGFIHVCAHEIGHALGLSTRKNYVPDSDKTDERTWGPGHDLGKWPLRGDVEEEGLMWPEAGAAHRWIRHEDWFKANDTAKVFH